MQLSQRLNSLVGHDVLVATRVQDASEDVPGGILEETGDGYLVIKTTETKETGGESNAQWFVSTPMIIYVVHDSDCRACGGK